MHIDSENTGTSALNEVLLMEKAGDLKGALREYEKLLKENKANEKIISRLIVLNHKLKNAKKELRYIELLIKTQMDLYKPKKKSAKNIYSLSQKLNLSLGMTDKKGNELNIPGHILKLQQRKERLIKKLEGK